MIVGIVGVEQAKFTPETEARARAYIRRLIEHPDCTGVTSGECHLGGVDIFAHEIADEVGKPFIPHPPAVLTWKGARGQDGFEARNLKIARDADLLVCITVKTLPETYDGMRFPGGCYHCKTPLESHIKSGGCWTMHQAAKLGKRTKLVVLD